MRSTLFILSMILGGLIAISLSGCASQQLAQKHWIWINEGNSGIAPGYSTGVNFSTYSVNGQTYQVISPAR